MNTATANLSYRQFMWGLSNGVVVLIVGGGFWLNMAAWFAGRMLLIPIGALAAILGYAAWCLRRRGGGFRLRELTNASEHQRDRTRRIQVGFRWATIAGESSGGEEALALVARVAPDLLFLDIEMPGMSGFDLLDRLDDVPPIIFTTAYDAYAIRAFEVNAIDYLLKPVAPARLAAAIARLAPKAAPRGGRPTLRQVFVREGERCWIVKLAEVFLLESEGNYTRLYFGKERPLLGHAF